jgi:hypothetical protein
MTSNGMGEGLQTKMIMSNKEGTFLNKNIVYQTTILEVYIM